MTRVYRILRRAWSKSPLDGEGAFRYGGRWSGPGTRLAYTAEHLSLAMIEYFVHVESEEAPKDLVVVAADVPDTMSRQVLTERDLPPHWRRTPAPAALATVGDAFAAQRRTAILVLPSVLAPTEANWLINPLHPAFSRIQVRVPERFRYDERFFGPR